MASVLGTTLSGRYRLEARIGSGGMSTVYRALDEKLQRRVAVKVMNGEVAGDADRLERFRREARAVARVNHLNVVGVIDAGDDAARPYIVFEYVEGETLKQRIRRLGPLPIPDAVAYAIEIGRGLGAAHARHIVHRDVKPQNVLIDEHGTARVTDFGIARTLEEHGLTDDGRVLGTTDYVSPEQALGRHVTGQSDLYSLGIVLYEMLTGELPFSGENQVAVAMKHVREQTPDVRAKRPEVSAALAAVVETATARKLEDRYADDRQLTTDLEELLVLESQRRGSLEGEATAVMRTLPADTRARVPLGSRHRRWATLGGLLVLAAVIAIAVLLGTHARPGIHHPTGGEQPPGVRATIRIDAATAYNPDGHGGTAQNNAYAPLAVDGNRATAWTTQTYFTASLDKPGVGIYVTVPAGTRAARMVLYTSTPGFVATVYATNASPDPNSFALSGWSAASAARTVRNGDSIPLSLDRAGDRHYLLWITQLPPRRHLASINEIELFQR
ncbi:MAG: protein kinase domain-containing protein [Solirubrobacteraceae bacterium]